MKALILSLFAGVVVIVAATLLWPKKDFPRTQTPPEVNSRGLPPRAHEAPESDPVREIRSSSEREDRLTTLPPEDDRNGEHVALPVLPPDDEGEDGLIGPSPFDPPADPNAFRTLLGFVGPYYNITEIEGHAAIIESTVNVAPQGKSASRIYALLRNSTERHVRVEQVTARLLDFNGKVLAAADAELPVSHLRPGEPAPVMVDADLAAESIASIDWQVLYSPETPPNRDFEITKYWSLPYGDRERMTGYPIDDPEVPPYPYMMFGAIKSLAPNAFGLRLVAAWLDLEGRVLHVGFPRFSIKEGEFAAQPLSPNLVEGDIVDFVYADRDPLRAPMLDHAAVALWGFSE